MAVQSKKVFIDSSVFYAFVNRAHPQHPQASAYFRYFAQEKYQVFTSYSVVLTSYQQIYDKISPSLAKDFLRGLSLSSINILFPTESEFKASLKALINYRTTEITLKDTQSAVLATRNQISQICTFDYLHPLFGLTAFYLPL